MSSLITGHGQAVASPVPGSKFSVDLSGVWYEPQPGDSERMFICSRIVRVAETRDEANGSWGRLLRWADAEGHLHEWVMPVAMLAGDSTAVRERLLSEGVCISTSRKARELFTEYLQQPAEKRIRCCSRIGWYNESFVLPDRTFSRPGAEEVRYQSHE
jgi:putative DNA primase/helicase